jgi:alpha,alpha-trehalase
MKDKNLLPPDKVYGELFEKVQLEHVFEDSKSFADAIPKFHPDDILKNFHETKTNEDFNLKQFILGHFSMPELYSSGFAADLSRSAVDHVKVLWPYLTRKGQTEKIDGSSLIPIPHDYVVPGGRFGEIYYWDSYFTMLGLALCGKTAMIRNMVMNFSHLIDQLGFIPNGNRSYFASRSQPPFYSLMVELLAEIEGEKVLLEFHDSLFQEYQFWMNNPDNRKIYRRVVKVGDYTVNRYWDDVDIARQEMYGEDLELADEYPNRNQSELFRDIRTACESGWDFTSRWFSDGETLGTIEASNIVPVDLNCLLWNLEKLLSKSFQLQGDSDRYEQFNNLAEQRKKAIHQIFWNIERKQFEDFHWEKNRNTGRLSMACCFPMFFNLADDRQAEETKQLIQNKFLAPGGLLTTPYNTGQQWDAPNGWAPLQWIGVKAFDNYGFDSLAMDCANRFCTLCESVYKNTGKFVEKYNVVDIYLLAGGGEYPVQDGFGWSNGVYLKLKEYLK